MRTQPLVISQHGLWDSVSALVCMSLQSRSDRAPPSALPVGHRDGVSQEVWGLGQLSRQNQLTFLSQDLPVILLEFQPPVQGRHWSLTKSSCEQFPVKYLVLDSVPLVLRLVRKDKGYFPSTPRTQWCDRNRSL